MCNGNCQCQERARWFSALGRDADATYQMKYSDWAYRVMDILRRAMLVAQNPDSIVDVSADGCPLLAGETECPFCHSQRRTT